MNLAPFHSLIRRFEGCRLHAYQCPAGVWTIGWGATGAGIGPGVTWSQAQADDRMAQDAAMFAIASDRLCPGLDDDQLSAVADFAYNLGLGRLKASTFRKRVLARDWPGARTELRKWTRGGGRVLPGLVARREAEAALLRG